METCKKRRGPKRHQEVEVDNKHLGSSFDDFLADEDILAESEAVAIRRVAAFGLKRTKE